MGKIEVRLKDNYQNEFLTTMAGAIIRHGEWVEVDENDLEIKSLLDQDHAIEVRGVDTMKDKIIIDEAPKDSIKEVVSKDAVKENERVIEEKKEPAPVEKEPAPAEEDFPTEDKPEEEPKDAREADFV